MEGTTAAAGRKPPVSLIMANRNNARSLDLFFERLERNTGGYPSFEIVIVDDESTDASLKILRRWRDSGRFRDFVLIERRHSGVMRSLNAALDAAGGELIAAVDGDATMETPGWLDRMVAFHQSDPRIGTVTGAVELDSGELQGYGMMLVCPEGPHGRGGRPTEPTGRRTAHELVANPRADQARHLLVPAEVDSALGPCMLYSRRLAMEIGGYDPGFSPVWFDDLDFSIAARRLGLKNFFVPVRVIHWIGLRHSRDGAGRLEPVRASVRAAGAKALPAGAKRWIWRAMRKDRIPPERWARYRHHYAYWREKWGWDFVNPDMDEVLRRWGDTEICWAYDAGMTAAGQDILRRWNAAPEGRSGSARGRPETREATS